MIIIKNDEIHVIKKINRKTAKIVVGFALFSFLFSIFLLFISFKFALVLVVINIYSFIVSIYNYKISGKEIRIISFGKENLKIYHKNKTETISTPDIIRFLCYRYNTFNEIYINYKVKNGNEKSKVFFLKGARNIDFVNAANRLLSNNFSTIEDNSNIEKLKENNSAMAQGFNKSVTEKELMRELYNGTKLKARFAGKTKSLRPNGGRKVLSTDVQLVFITEEMIPLYFDILSIGDDSFKLDCNKTYILEFDKNNKRIKTIETEEQLLFDERFEILKKSLEIQNNICFNMDRIKDELKVDYKYYKTIRITKRILKVIFFVIIIITAICVLLYNKKIDKMIEILVNGALILLSAFGVLIVYTKKKLTDIDKKYDIKSKK